MNQTLESAKLVVFWTYSTRPDYAATRYQKKRKVSEFPAETDPAIAIESIYAEHGRLYDRAVGGSTPLSYAEVASHRIVHHHDRAEIETWTAVQEQLLDGVTWQRCLSYKPE